MTGITGAQGSNATKCRLGESDVLKGAPIGTTMVFAIFLILLSIFSACLVLVGVAFYVGWDVKCQMEREFDALLHRLNHA